MYGQIFIPSEQKSYSYLQAEKFRQKQLQAEGKIKKTILTDDVFSPEQEAEFGRRVVIDDIYQSARDTFMFF